MAKEKDDMIDFRKLEAELSNAIAKDEKYQRENDAKFRAIHQKVATYDEFRDIVLASNLKPLDKKDITGGMPYQPWNKMVSNTKDNPKENEKQGASKTEWAVPKTSAQFDKIWKHSCKTLKDKFDFLLAIGPEDLRKILVTDCPLGEIITCIKSEAQYPENLEAVLGTLGAVSHSKRFSLTLDFLDGQEVSDLKHVFNAGKSAIESSDDNVESERRYRRTQVFDDLNKKYSSVL